MMKNQGYNVAIADNGSSDRNGNNNNSNSSSNRNYNNDITSSHSMQWSRQERVVASGTGPGTGSSLNVGAATGNSKYTTGNNLVVPATGSKTDDIGREFDMMLGIELRSSLQEEGNNNNNDDNNNNTSNSTGLMNYADPEAQLNIDTITDSVNSMGVLQQQSDGGEAYSFDVDAGSAAQDKRTLATPVASNETNYRYADIPPAMRSGSSCLRSRNTDNGDLNNFIMHGQLNNFLSDISPSESTASYSQMLYPQSQRRSVSNILPSNNNRRGNDIAHFPRSAATGVVNETRYSNQQPVLTHAQRSLDSLQNISASRRSGLSTRVRTPQRKVPVPVPVPTAESGMNYGHTSRSNSSENKMSNSRDRNMGLDLLNDQQGHFSQQIVASTTTNSDRTSMKQDPNLSVNGNNNFSVQGNSRSSTPHNATSGNIASTISELDSAAGPADPQRAKDYSNVNRQVLYQMTMNNNAHLINDPSIQENLSPYFTPFGIDVSHLPMTNPPIFQCSVPVYDVPVRKRRISISNGQISQLGEDIETVDDLYNTQPPPMPKPHHVNSNNNNTNNNTSGNVQLKSQSIRPAYPQKYGQEQYQQQQHQENIPSYIRPQLPSQQPEQFTQRQGSLSHTSDQNYNEMNASSMNIKVEEDNSNVGIAQDISRSSSNIPTNHQQQQHFVAQGVPSAGSQQPIQNQIPGSQQQQQLYQYQLQQERSQTQQNYDIRSSSSQIPHKQAIYANTPVLPMSMLPTSINDPLIQSNDELTPGTKAWKKARLLERNRIAASKCRQRKKMAQLQLQKDFDKMSKENIILRKKVIYYEKLISKFKKFAESNFKARLQTNSDGKNSVKIESGDDGRSQLEQDSKFALKVIQEMLMIDEDISEVDESGKVTKMYLNGDNYTGGGDLSLDVDVDVDINNGVGAVKSVNR